MKFDFSDFNQSIANSATKIAEINHQHEESLLAAAQANQKRIEREERMVAGAEANIAQKELLEQQVEIFRKQNELLSDNYSKLKEMFDTQVEANIQAKEKLYPEVEMWETATPYFETRNIHFYVNRCGFHIVKFFNKYHPGPKECDDQNSNTENDMDGMFRFQKIMK